MAYNRPMYLEYEAPKGRPRRYCCYKDDPCPIHAAAFDVLVRAAIGQSNDPSAELADISNNAKKNATRREN